MPATCADVASSIKDLVSADQLMNWQFKETRSNLFKLLGHQHNSRRRNNCWKEGQFDSSATRSQLATSSCFFTGVLLVTSHSSNGNQTDSAPPS
nr:unnamed protein product [Callosobruchus chinensis]